MRTVPTPVASILCLFFAFYSSSLRAQSTNASLVGRITDPSRAAIAQAQVVAVSIATNLRYETTSND